MVEQVIRDYLNTVLPDAVWLERPARPPSRYYIIEKTGGGMTNRIRSATLAIQSYAPKLEEAAQMNAALIEAMTEGAVTRDEIAGISLNADYNFTDTETKEYRYQAVFDITHY